jgi:hypothetical protein
VVTTPPAIPAWLSDALCRVGNASDTRAEDDGGDDGDDQGDGQDRLNIMIFIMKLK